MLQVFVKIGIFTKGERKNKFFQNNDFAHIDFIAKKRVRNLTQKVSQNHRSKLLQQQQQQQQQHVIIYLDFEKHPGLSKPTSDSQVPWRFP